MGKFEKHEKKPEQKKLPGTTPRAILIQKLRERAKIEKEEREKELILELSQKLKAKKKPEIPKAQPITPKAAPTKPKAPQKTPLVPLTPQKATKKSPEKPKYFSLPKDIKARILSQREKIRLGIKENPDPIGHKLKRKGKTPTPEQLAKIRKNSEFLDTNNSGTPLVEIDQKDLDKVVLTCGTKKNPVNYKLKEFLRIDPKDIDDAPQGTHFEINGEYYRRITRLNPTIIQKFGRLHRELEDLVNKMPAFTNDKNPNILKQGPEFMGKAAKKLSKGMDRISVRLYIDENYRSYGENLHNYTKKGTSGKAIKYGSRHTAGDALDLQTHIIVDGKRIEGSEAENLLRQAIAAEWNKNGGGRGFYTNNRNFHIDARNKLAQWGPGW